MFQVEIILFLQSIAGDAVNAFFRFWTVIGHGTGIFAAVLAVMFGFRFRTGIILAYAAAVNAVVTYFLKDLFALPRPSSMDARVRLPGREDIPGTPFRDGGSDRFFGALPRKTLSAFRLDPFDTWGFPSGHTSGAVSFWGSLLTVWRFPWFRAAAAAALLCIPLSRMVLGRHFLADVLGGYAVGLTVVFGVFRPMRRSRRIQAWLDREDPSGGKNRETPIILILIAIPPALLLIPGIDPLGPAFLLGLNLSVILLRRRGFPADDGTLLQRILRVLAAVALFLGARILLTEAAGRLVSEGSRIFEIFRTVPALVLCIWGGVELGIRLGLFKRADGGAALPAA